jgi:hypothetical protein
VLVAAAVCPHPPLLVPAVAAGAAAELDDLRTACTQAVGQLLSAEPGTVCIVGGAAAGQWYGKGAGGSFRPYGVPLDIALDTEVSEPPTMPLSVTVGAWLLGAAGWSGHRRALGVPPQATGAHLVDLAAEVVDADARVGLLVMGDGSARRSKKAPGYDDPRAACFDATVASALATADTAGLVALDQQLGDQLLAAGTASWRLLGYAGAGAAWEAQLLSSTAPYGVGYFVAVWSRRP